MDQLDVRFIPAYAGNTAIHASGIYGLAVHPRLRGEHSTSFICSSVIRGSSPPTRGTQAGNQQTSGICRFIPAYAGNTQKKCRVAWLVAVHPRLRGEHQVNAVKVTWPGGSSPPTRGTPSRRPPPAGSPRFIPAYAGNT